MSYTNWSSGEPNNSGNGGQLYGDTGAWDDTGADNLKYAVYEIDGTWPDADNNHQPDAFEDKNGDLIPDEFGVPMPNADFVADDTTVDMGTTVSFTDLSDGNGETITAWAWDFDGDGVTDSTVKNPTWTYNEAMEPSSTFTVSLTVTTINNPGADDVRTDTATKANYITVKYVCPFKGQLQAQGAEIAALFLDDDPVFDATLKSVLDGLPQTSWSTFDLEGIEANFIMKAGTSGDGLPDAAQMALIEAVVCNPLSWAYDIVFAGMNTNRELFLDDIATLAATNTKLADFAQYGDLFAALIGSSEAMKTSVNQIFALLGAPLPSFSEYVVFGNAKAGDLFSADGDLDGDLLTNKDEYDQVVAVGGGIDTFVDAATDPGNFWPGNPDLPVAGILGLGLLAGSLLAGAALSFRKK
jgi:PKD repeat protein